MSEIPDSGRFRIVTAEELYRMIRRGKKPIAAFTCPHRNVSEIRDMDRIIAIEALRFGDVIRYAIDFTETLGTVVNPDYGILILLEEGEHENKNRD